MGAPVGFDIPPEHAGWMGSDEELIDARVVSIPGEGSCERGCPCCDHGSQSPESEIARVRRRIRELYSVMGGARAELRPRTEAWVGSLVEVLNHLIDRGWSQEIGSWPLRASVFDAYLDVMEADDGRGRDPNLLFDVLYETIQQSRQEMGTLPEGASIYEEAEPPFADCWHMVVGPIDECITLPACLMKHAGWGGGFVAFGQCTRLGPGCNCLVMRVSLEVLLLMLLMVGLVAGTWKLSESCLKLLWRLYAQAAGAA